MLWEVVAAACSRRLTTTEALRCSSRVVLFRDPKVDAEGKPDEIFARLTMD